MFQRDGVSARVGQRRTCTLPGDGGLAGRRRSASLSVTTFAGIVNEKPGSKK